MSEFLTLAQPHNVTTNIRTIRKRLNQLHDDEELSWRKIAALPEYAGLAAGTLCSIADGYEPKRPAIRSRLGLPSLVGAAALAGIVMESGALIGVDSRTCAKDDCAVEFIPNAGLRKYCFYCSPVRRSK